MVTEIFIFGVLSLYAAVITAFQAGLDNLRQKKYSETPIPSDHLIGISVVIAVRNEEQNIEALISDLNAQNYPSTFFEVILVNDYSHDKTYEKAKEAFLNSRLDFQIHYATGGKKSALKMGADKSKHPILAFTDGDCRLSVDWLSGIADAFSDEAILMVSGPVFFTAETFFQKILALEFGSLVASGAASIGLQRPIMVNGANLAVKKTAWYTAQNNLLNSRETSGDDVFAMSEIAKSYGRKKIIFIHHSKAVVLTKPPHSFSAFIQQRMRWTSKSKSYRDFWIIAVAVLVLLTAAVQIYTLLNPLLWHFNLPVYFLLFTGLKLMLDLPFLNNFLRSYQREKWTRLAPILSLIYPFYIVMIALAGNLGSYEWKKRKY